MQYARFVRLRRGAWDDFEQRLDAARRGVPLRHTELEQLAVQYRHILHDWALARARYAGTAAALRLRALATDGTHWLNVDRRSNRFGLVRFVTHTYPLAFRRHLPYLLVAALLFVVSFALGGSLTVVEPAVGLGLLGPEAVEGMRQGKLWTDSLTSAVPPAFSSSAIAKNNMSVAMTAWAGGALAGLGALYVVVLNGFMLGAILAATLGYGLTGRLLEFVSAHGPLEITLILVSAAGGLALGHALVGAEDRPRRVMAREAGVQSVLLLLGCLPWFLALGFVEGFVSPSTAIPPALKTAVGLSLLAVFLALAWNPLLVEEEDR